MADVADAVEPVLASADHAARRIVFQGRPGAYSHLACRQVCPHLQAVPAESFEEAFAAAVRATPSGR